MFKNSSPPPTEGGEPEKIGTSTTILPTAAAAGSTNGTHTLPPDPPKEELDGEAYKQAGNRFFKQKEYMKSVEQYSKAIEFEPENATFLSNRAAAYMLAGKYKEALADCMLSDRYSPDNEKTLLRMARVQVAIGRPEDAIATYDRIQSCPSVKDRAPAVQMLQHLTSARQSVENGTSGSMTLYALDRAESGLGAGVDTPKEWKLLRGEANLKMGTQHSLSDAQNVAMSILRQNQQDSDALVLRGRILYCQGDNTKAAAHFAEALRCDPDMKQAKIFLRKARELERKKADGNEAFKKGDFAKAKELYSQALSVDPENKGTNSKIYQNRAVACNKVFLSCPFHLSFLMCYFAK
jgi:DnaJ family protein C protein 7